MNESLGDGRAVPAEEGRGCHHGLVRSIRHKTARSLISDFAILEQIFGF